MTTHTSCELWVTATIHRMDCHQPKTVRPHQLSKGLQWDGVPSLHNSLLQQFWVTGPPVIAVTNALDHPTPHDLNQIEIGRVWWPRRQTIEFPSLLGHLGPFVLLTAVVHALLPYQLPDLILLILSRGVADDVDTVLCVARADCGVIVR